VRPSYITNDEKKSDPPSSTSRHVRGCWSRRTQNTRVPTVNAQTALNLASLLASRSGATRPASSSTFSFCAVEASMRVPLDSLRTCERKCRRLNARGRPSFNCLPLVTWRPRRSRRRRKTMYARISFESALLAFFSHRQSYLTANLS